MQEVKKANFEKFDASGYKVGIVVAQFNRDVTEELLKSALDMLESYRVGKKNIKVLSVAGSIEIPVVLKHLAASKNYDCLLAIGAIIRGETPHFDYVAKIVSEGVLQIMVEYGIPVGFGVLTTEDKAQAASRFHVGFEAVEAAIQNAKIIKEISE